MSFLTEKSLFMFSFFHIQRKKFVQNVIESNVINWGLNCGWGEKGIGLIFDKCIALGSRILFLVAIDNDRSHFGEMIKEECKCNDNMTEIPERIVIAKCV